MSFLLALFMALAPGPTARAVEWAWPLAPPAVVVRPFQPPPQPWLAGHRGVDLAGVPGQEVRAAGRGVVTFAGPLAGRPVVVVSHGALRTTYEPVQPSVSVGDRVGAGSVIGRLSATGSHCGLARTCLHWGLLRGVTYLDPLVLLTHPPIRLLPRTGGAQRSPGQAPVLTGRASERPAEGVRFPDWMDADSAASGPAERRGSEDSPASTTGSSSMTALAPVAVAGALGLGLAAPGIRRRLRGQW